MYKRCDDLLQIDHVDIVCSKIQIVFITLKCVYKVKRKAYIYNVKNFFLYLMWDILMTPSPKQTLL